MCYKCHTLQKWICIIEENKPKFEFKYETTHIDVYITVEHQVEWYYFREFGRKYPSVRLKEKKNGYFHGKSIHGTQITLNKKLNEAFSNALANYMIEQEILDD